MSNIPVYIGRWQDHSRSQALGDTITLSVRSSHFLIGALATFIGLVGTALWSLVAFAIHQCRASPGKEDGVFFQQQVIYRNQGSPMSAVIELVKVCWAWRHSKAHGRRASQLKFRSCSFSLPPLIIFIAFTAAGTFIGDIAGQAYESNFVRVAEGRCGAWYFDIGTDDGLRGYLLKEVNDTLASRAYAKNCYDSTSANSASAGCSVYPVQKLPYNSSIVNCPFGLDPSGKGSCIPSNGSALEVDTGLLDTNEYFGINADAGNRILLRNRVTCSPINTAPYIGESNSSTGGAGFVVGYFWLGSLDNGTNYTFSYDSHTRFDTVSYQIFPFSDQQGWHPITAFNVSGADINVYFLASNSVLYLGQVLDPWFSATTATSGPSYYESDVLVSTLACMDQYQICNPSTTPHSCTTIGGHSDLVRELPIINLNDYQTATANRIALTLSSTTTYSTVSSLGDSALLAQERLDRVGGPFISVGLPTNQWQIEVQGWFESSLARLQALTVQYVANDADLGPYGYVIAPDGNGDPVSKALKDQCSNQRIRNTGAYQSFSFLGLMVVICLGSTIMILSWVVEALVRLKRKRSNRHDFREVARIADRKLQLQRMALLGAGYDESWVKAMNEVPVTTRNAKFSTPTRYSHNGDDDYRYIDSQPLLAMAPDNKPTPTGPESSPTRNSAAPLNLSIPQSRWAEDTESALMAGASDNLPSYDLARPVSGITNARERVDSMSSQAALTLSNRYYAQSHSSVEPNRDFSLYETSET